RVWPVPAGRLSSPLPRLADPAGRLSSPRPYPRIRLGWMARQRPCPDRRRWYVDLHAEAKELAPDLVTLRRDLHQIPEIGLDLPLTQQRVLAALDGLPLEISLGRQLTSVTAVLRGGRPGPAVLLRGDMDALPVTERTGEEFSSRHPGAMHACGHDL